MEENKASYMAMIMSYCRGYHATYDNPKIFNDFLAYDLIGEEQRALFDQRFTPPIQQIAALDPAFAESGPDQAAALAWVMQRFMPVPLVVSRARYTEDNLEQGIRQGGGQYVILGAGLDSFAFRCPELVEQLQVFEVDHPATQAFKRHHLAELGWKHPAQLHFVPVDFTQESWATKLANSCYDPQVLSFFSCLGVTYYLTRDEVFAILSTIANIAPKGSTIIFDYFDTDVFVPEKTTKLMQNSLEEAQKRGEPIKTGFDPSMLATDLASLGLRLHEDLSPHDIEERFFQGRTDNYHAYELMHFASALVV